MISYKKAGVDLKTGDEASKIAYKFAKSTFASRKGMIGTPVILDGSFTGMMDMGDYYIVQGDDGVGTKIEVAECINKYDTLGFDLLAMVADDAICLGAETLSITNTIDTNKIDTQVVAELMKGLAKACTEHKVIIPGGEIAELGNTINGNIWNATAIGVLEKSKFIPVEEIRPGDNVIALREDGFRSNGFSLARYILEKEFGKNAYKKNSPYKKSWGEMILRPSKIYSSALLDLLGRFSKIRKFNIKGLAHITGGGIPGNLNRILRQTGLGADLNDLYVPPTFMKEIQKIGKVSDKEAYKTWNMGNGMLLVVDTKDADQIIESIYVEAQIVGSIIEEKKITINSKGVDQEKLMFKI